MDATALPTLGSLTWEPALDHLDLVAPVTADALRRWADADPDVAARVAVTEIDPGLADTAALNDAFSLPVEASANCVVVGGSRAGWRVLLDARVVHDGALALVGSGVRRSKLLLPGALLGRLPGAEVVDDLAVPVG